MKSILLKMRARVVRWIKNFYLRPNSEEVRLVLHWLSSEHDEIPSASMGQAICRAIELQVVNKMSHKDIAEMLYGLIQYRRTGLTPSHAHYAYIRAYEQTNGLAQELFHQALFTGSTNSLPAFAPSPFFQGINLDNMNQLVGELHKNGYCFLGNGLPAAVVDELLKRISFMRFSPQGLNQWELLDPNDPPECNVAYASKPDLTAVSLVSQLANDPVLVNVASAYLRANSSLMNISTWYTFPADQESVDAAQFFHYDLDTLRWLKVFIFLSDVGPENGPHEYVEGSHQPGTIPVELLRRDYSRLPDKDVDRYYAGKRKQLLVPKGSVVLADTRCFHKGVNPVSGYRLLMQFIYAPSRLSYDQY